MAQLEWLRQKSNQASNSGTKLNRRFVVFLRIRNLFIAGRKLNVFHLFLPGLVVQLGTAFL